MNSQTPRLRGIIFDLDGVVAETEDLHRQAYNLAFEEAGLGVRWSERDYRARLAMTAGSKLSTIDTPAGEADPNDFRGRIYDRKRFHYITLLESTPLEPRPGVIRLVDEALDRNVKVGAASTCAKEGAHAILEHAIGETIISRFTVIRAGDDVDHRKPAPDIYLSALEGLDLEASNCVAIEDTRHGLQAAKAAGLWTLVTPSQYTLGDDFPEADGITTDLESGGIHLRLLEDRLRDSTR